MHALGTRGSGNVEALVVARVLNVFDAVLASNVGDTTASTTPGAAAARRVQQQRSTPLATSTTAGSPPARKAGLKSPNKASTSPRHGWSALKTKESLASIVHDTADLGGSFHHDDEAFGLRNASCVETRGLWVVGTASQWSTARQLDVTAMLLVSIVWGAGSSLQSDDRAKFDSVVHTTLEGTVHEAALPTES